MKTKHFVASKTNHSYQGGFHLSVEKQFSLLLYTIGLKNSRQFLTQSEVKPGPVVSRSQTFSGALRQLHVFLQVLIGSLDCLCSL